MPYEFIENTEWKVKHFMLNTFKRNMGYEIGVS